MMKCLVAALVMATVVCAAHGSGCGTVYVNRGYGNAYYAQPYGYNYNYQYTPFLAASYVEQPLYIPTYLVGYNSSAALQERIQQLEKKLDAALSRTIPPAESPPVRTSPPPVSAPQMPPAAQEPAAYAPEQLQVALQSGLTKCAVCHEREAAQAKGNGYVMFSGGKSRAFSPAEELKLAQEVHSGHMPLRGVLTPAEKRAVLDWILTPAAQKKS